MSKRIEETSNQFQIYSWYMAIPVIVAALLLQWYAHSGGKGLLLTDDSYHYIAAGKSFANSFTFTDSENHNFLFWPPLFPVILSIIGPSGESLIWLNMILLIFIAAAIFHLIDRIHNNSVIKILCFIFVLLGVHLLLISSFLWSEFIFLFFVLFFVTSLLKSKQNKTYLYFACIIGFFMCLQRNAGLFIVTGAAIWLFVNEDNGKIKFAKPITFFLLVTSGLLIWNAYVWIVVPHEHFDFSGKLFQHALQNSSALAQSIIHTFLPMKVLSIPILLSSFLILLYSIRKEIWKNESLQLVFIVSVVYAFFLYLVLIINIAGFPIDVGEADRFISVIVPFLGMLFFKSVEIFLQRQNNTIRLACILLLICWLSYPIARSIKNAKQWHSISAKNAMSHRDLPYIRNHLTRRSAIGRAYYLQPLHRPELATIFTN